MLLANSSYQFLIVSFIAVVSQENNLCFTSLDRADDLTVTRIQFAVDSYLLKSILDTVLLVKTAQRY